MSKSWDFSPEPNEMSARIAARAQAREMDMHAALSDDERYAKQHEALQRMASLLAECVDDFLDRSHIEASREKFSSDLEIHALYVDERTFHRNKIARILLNEALEKMKDENSSD